MKIRTDFVTNSSSSSYTTAKIKSSKLVKMMKLYGQRLEEELGYIPWAVDFTYEDDVLSLSWDDVYFFNGRPDSPGGVIDCLLTEIERCAEDESGVRPVVTGLSNRRQEIAESLEEIDWNARYEGFGEEDGESHTHEYRFRCGEAQFDSLEEELNTSVPEAASVSLNKDVSIELPNDKTAVGDVVDFGRWPSTPDAEANPIAWKVVYAKGPVRLLLSEYVLEQMRFSERDSEDGWEYSQVRKWLNSSFIEGCFTEDERVMMVPYGSPDFDNRAAADGLINGDFAFLLSEKEAKKYLKGGKDVKVCTVAPWMPDEGEPTEWWLRFTDTQDSSGKIAINCVLYTGRMSSRDPRSWLYGVRPALLLNVLAAH